jgi:trehalose 6-phosphate phosphatase
VERGARAWAQALEPIRRQRGSAGVFLDFDGTIAEIARLPQAALPFPGFLPLIDELASSYAVVAVLSGRPSQEVRRFLPSSRIEVLGSYGMIGDPKARSSVRGVVHEVTDIAAAVPGAWVEDKGSTIAVHYRNAAEGPTAERLLAAPLRELAGRSGMGLLRGKKVLELLPLDAPGKGGALVREVLAHDLSACLVAGDDLADLDTFQAIERLRDSRVHGVRVAVRSEETPEELCRAADLVVEGPAGLLALLGSLR